MYKKIIVSIISLIIITVNIAYADFTAVWDYDGNLVVTVPADDGDNIGIVIKNAENELLYLDQGKGNGTFKTNITDQTNINISVGSDAVGLSAFESFNRNEKIIYVSETGNDSNSGKADAPLKTIDAALKLADENTIIEIIGTITVEKIIADDVTITGGNIQSAGNGIAFSGVKLKDVTISTSENEILTLWNGSVIDEKTNFINPVIVECSDNSRILIKSGVYKDIKVNNSELHLFEKVRLTGEIINSDNGIIVFEDGINYDNYLKDKKGLLFYLSKGGSLKREGDMITILPEDKRVFSINDGVYQAELKQGFENGIYNIDFNYNFKIEKISFSNKSGEYTIDVDTIANNLNNEESKNSPILLVSVYDENNKLKCVTFESITSKKHSFSYITGEIKNTDKIKIFMWDSFARMIPIASVVQMNGSDATVTETIDGIFVANDGNDGNLGTIENPVKTIKKAQELARKSKATVYFREGEYYIDSPINFTASDDNTTYKAYNNENVVFTTVKTIKGENFAAADDDFKARLIDNNAKDKILCADISSYAKDLKFKSFSSNANELNPALFVDNQKMIYARYPDASYSTIATVISDGGGANSFSIKMNDISERSAQWNGNDIMIFGYFEHNWADCGYLGNITDGTYVSDDKYYRYKPTENSRVFAANVPEELSMPGEYYIDFQEKKLYLYPYEGFSESSNIKYNIPDDKNNSCVNIKSVRNLSIEGIKFDAISQNNAIYIENSENINVSDCEFTNILGTAINTKDIKKCNISDNYFHDISSKGVVVSGGKVTTFEYADNTVCNNKFERFAQDKKTYQPAIQIYGVGNVISHNDISDSAHMGIGYQGNFNIIEYNELYNLCNDTNDVGAIYAGFTFLSAGNTIRYNYLHDIIGTADEFEAVRGVYFDERFSGQNVYSNVFENVDGAVFIGSGRYNNIEKNIFIECGKSVIISRYGNPATLESVPEYYDKNIWYSKFDWLENLANDNPDAPKYNKINYNLYFNSPEIEFNEWKETFAECEMTNIGNKSSIDADIFADYGNGDYSIENNSSIFKMISKFNNIDFGNIGIIR